VIAGFNTGPLLLKIVESTAACRYVRQRTYAKRRSKSPAHWRRMDKKYLKRYGMIPECYQMFDTWVVHPMLAADLRNTLKTAVGSLG
jgi:hypothetical protein